MASKPVADSASKGPLQLENTEKRDTLQALEKKYQNDWASSKVFEADAPSTKDVPVTVSNEELHKLHPKFFGTMAYPYTNGVPHLGHGYTISKIEFQARTARKLGKAVLYPQGYHVTGMPIKACADKLVREVELFGKNFERAPEFNDNVEQEEEAPLPAPTQVETKTDITKFKNAKRGKAALKGGTTRYQYQSMLSMGVPKEEIHKFADSMEWLRYFPALWQRDLTAFGCGIDWRRSFVTTDVNPYYDAFVQWQMKKLRSLNRIQFGKRYTVYSPLDQQACLDHDRASGEGINSQEYTCLKARVKTWSDSANKVLEGKLPANAKVYLVAATLRPETMYGQSNMFVAPAIKYGIFQASETEYFLMTQRAARNCAYQEIFAEAKWGEVRKVADILGKDVIGSLVEAPLSVFKDIYVVPMDTIKENKGTGVVTSVPSDSPDDYIMSKELAKKAAFYGIDPAWVKAGEEPLPIIEVPGYGSLIAKFLVEKLKIQSPKDAVKLAEAKDEAYKEGFYHGTMVYGEFKGKTVGDAKDLVRKKLIDSGDAFAYAEPDGLVMSRSGDECVAAHLDQWFLTYGDGDPEWRAEVLSHVGGDDGENFNSFGGETKKALQSTLNWMNNWAVTRQFGLGTKLPWDKSQLVESLSDSTIYMAYYTLAHYFHKDIYGNEKGIGNIDVSQLNDEFWEYIFDLSNDIKSDIPKDTLEAMKREFKFWYPLDVRISGKDLLNNHLIFFLYIHQAVWGKAKPEYLPRGIRVNGHALMNGEKMSKSTGNFLTLNDALKKFGADAVRLALADAGDAGEDANFDETVANATILKLFELKKWCEEAVVDDKLRTGEHSFWDQVFDNEMNILGAAAIKDFELTYYKAALGSGWYSFTLARDSYRVSTAATGGMHADLVRKYIELQALLLSVVTPHWSEYIWLEVLKKPSTIQNATYPQLPAPNPSITAAMEYSRMVSSSIGSTEGNMLKKAGKGKELHYDPKKDKKLTIYVASSWPEWQNKCLELVVANLEGMTLDTKKLMSKIPKAETKKSMPFIAALKKKLEVGEKEGKTTEEVLERKLAFDEKQVLEEMRAGLKATVIRCKEVEIVEVEGDVAKYPQAAQSAEPGNPGIGFVNI